MSIAPEIERARRLLTELKALYDELCEQRRSVVREQFAFCAENCVPKEDVHV